MTDLRKRLILELSIGDINHPVLPILHFLTRFKRCDEILNWLLKNRLTGNEIVLAVKYQFQNSQLTFVKWVLSRIDKNKELKPIIVGVDYQ